MKLKSSQRLRLYIYIYIYIYMRLMLFNKKKQRFYLFIYLFIYYIINCKDLLIMSILIIYKRKIQTLTRRKENYKSYENFM